MGTGFKRHLRWVAGIHVIVLVSLIVPGCSRWWERRQEVPQIVEFEVDVSVLNMQDEPLQPEPGLVQEPDPDPEPELVEEPEPDPDPEPEAKPDPPPDPPKPPKIVRGPRIVRSTGQPQPQLSAEEVRRLLAEGAKPSNRTVLPGEDQRCFSMIHRAFYTAWEQPPRASVGDAMAQVSLTFGNGGRITRSSLSRASGVAEMDASVRSVLTRVTSVPGLTKGFIERHPEVTVGFKLE